MDANIDTKATLANEAIEHVEDEHIPGTEVMRDHDGLRLKRSGGVVLVPQPSSDPHDPLNWSPKWKAIVICTQAFFVWVTILGPLSLPPLNGMLAEEFNLGPEAVGMLTGALVLSMGYANFIIVPCSNIFGRRITAIGTCILAIVFTIWEAAAKTHMSFLASRIMNGMATAVNETMMVQVIADVFFIHQRGRLMAFYFTSFFMGLFIGPIISGNIAERHGWRSFFWLCVGLGVVNLINLIFGHPETRYYRANDVQRESSGVEDVDEKHDIHHTQDTNSHDVTPSEDDGAGQRAGPKDVEAAVGATDGGWTGRGRPSAQQWKLWQPIDPNWKSTLAHDLLSPWPKFFNPIVLWASVSVMGAANCLLYWNLTEAMFLAAPPYNFSPSAIGYVNFAFVVGGLVGLSTAGPLSDWLASYLTRRNGGIREAEFRLPALIPYCIIATTSLVVGSIGFERLWNWPIMVVVGYGFTGVTVTSIPSIAVAYAVDCYTPISGDIMVIATVFKNTIGFSLPYWIYDLIERKGMVTTTMVQLAICIGPASLAIPLYFFGKRIRRMTRNSGWHKEKAQ